MIILLMWPPFTSEYKNVLKSEKHGSWILLYIIIYRMTVYVRVSLDFESFFEVCQNQYNIMMCPQYDTNTPLILKIKAKKNIIPGICHYSINNIVLVEMTTWTSCGRTNSIPDS